MGPWLVLVSPCFRENVVATCKIGSFWCSFDNLLQKNVIVLFFGNQLSKWRSFEKRAIFDLLFTLFSHQGKVTKIPSAHISLTYIHLFCSPYWLFVPYQFWKEYKFIRYGFSWYESWCWLILWLEMESLTTPEMQRMKFCKIKKILICVENLAQKWNFWPLQTCKGWNLAKFRNFQSRWKFGLKLRVWSLLTCGWNFAFFLLCILWQRRITNAVYYYS